MNRKKVDDIVEEMRIDVQAVLAGDPYFQKEDFRAAYFIFDNWLVRLRRALAEQDPAGPGGPDRETPTREGTHGPDREPEGRPSSGGTDGPGRERRDRVGTDREPLRETQRGRGPQETPEARRERLTTGWGPIMARLPEGTVRKGGQNMGYQIGERPPDPAPVRPPPPPPEVIREGHVPKPRPERELPRIAVFPRCPDCRSNEHVVETTDGRFFCEGHMTEIEFKR